MVSARLVPLRAVMMNLFHASWCSLACTCITLISAFMFTRLSPSVPACVQISPFCDDTTHAGLGTHLTLV